MNEPGADEAFPDAFLATQVVLREREARDRGWWGEMAGCFWADSYVETSWFRGSGTDFTAASRAMSGSAPSRHRLGPPTVRVSADRGVVCLPAAVETYPTVGGIDCVLVAHCRLLYRVRKANHTWRIARLEAVYERDELRATLPGGVVAVDSAELDGLRMSYRLLAWSVARAGYPVSQELPGDDRPEVVNALYDAAYNWAGIPVPEP